VSLLWLLVVSGAIACLKAEQLESLFTGLGFVGLVATFWHERSKSEEAEHEHSEVLEEMRRNTAMSTQANRIAILTARLNALNESLTEAARSRPIFGDKEFLERAEVLKQLKELLGTLAV